jgi:metal-responsive CopG/Arc/MetJ family transcriptional regulator
MATIKTAISLQDSLFEQVEDLARNLNVSRSQVVALALEEFVQRHQNRQLLDALNHAYGDISNADDLPRTPARKRQHRRLVEGEW